MSNNHCSKKNWKANAKARQQRSDARGSGKSGKRDNVPFHSGRDGHITKNKRDRPQVKLAKQNNAKKWADKKYYGNEDEAKSLLFIHFRVVLI